MKVYEFQLLKRSIDHVVICWVPEDSGSWEVWAYGDFEVSNPIHAARGDRRSWKTAESALQWVLSQGYGGKVEIDQSEQSVPMASATGGRS